MIEFWQRLIKAKELRKKILITVSLLACTRILAHIPLLGVTPERIIQYFNGAQSQTLGLLDLFSGGAIARFSIILMGVGPYITATIIIQLLTVIVPSLEALSKEGEFGKHRMNQITRYITVPLAFIESYGMLLLLKSQNIVGDWNMAQLVSMMLMVTAGTMLMMWIGEIISESGIGNGISLIITVGILAGLPTTIAQKYNLIMAGGAIDTKELYKFAIFIVSSLILIGIIVLMNDAVRKIPVTYARRQSAGGTGGVVNSYLPIKVNIAGVIPIIFGISMLLLPQIIGRFFANVKTEWLSHAANWFSNTFSSQANPLIYGITYFILVLFFTFFYTSIILNPTQIAENLQKQGGFIPGIRPGTETAAYVSALITKITIVGAIFLGLVAVLPVIVPLWTGDQSLVLGGTGILIVVSVIIETMRQVQAQLVMTSYDRY